MRLAPLVLCACLGVAAVPGGAAAQPQPPASGRAIETARARYKEGAQAFQQKRYKDAIDLFLEADRLASSPAFAFNVAIAYEAMGDTANTLRWLRTYLRRAPDAADRAAVEERVRTHEQKLAARGVQQVTLLSTPEGATVELDGRAVGVTPWTGEIAPGAHEAVLQLRGYKEAQQRFDLAADRASDVTVTLEVAPAETAAATPVTRDTPTPAAPAEGGGVGPATWILLGVGVAGLGTALGFELARKSAEDGAREAPTQVDAAEQLDTMEGRRTAARIFLGVGGAAFLAGGVMLAIDLASGGGEAPSARTPRAKPRLSAGCLPGGCAAQLRGAF